MSNVFHRTPLATMPVAVGGSGIYIDDAAGRRYLDASGGAAVSCLGHGHPRVVAAIVRQAEQLAYAHSSFFTTQVAEDLANTLLDGAPDAFRSVWFVSGGSEAVEAALKMARQYFVEIGELQRHNFIARRQSYHGNTLGALGIGGNARRRERFLPLLPAPHHVSPCYAYRERRDDENDAQYVARLAGELDESIHALGVQNVAAFVAETVVGATAGAVPPVEGYFRAVREVCDRHGVLLILDEVMSGMGRTGYRYAFEEDGIVPDIVCVAKGLGGGYQPIGATIANARVYDAIVGGSGAFQHGHTYGGHPIACAAALETQRVIAEDRLLDNVRARGEQLRARLRERIGAHPNVGDIRGRGLFVGIELVASKATKDPLDPARSTHALVKAAAMQRGLMVYPAGGTIDGTRGDHVLLAPPFICTPAEIDLIVERLSDALEDVLPAHASAE